MARVIYALRFGNVRVLQVYSMTIHVFTTNCNFYEYYRNLFPIDKDFKIYSGPSSLQYYKQFDVHYIHSLAIETTDVVIIVSYISRGERLLDFVDGALANRFNNFHDEVVNYGCPFIYIAHFESDAKLIRSEDLERRINDAAKLQSRLTSLIENERVLFLPDKKFRQSLARAIPSMVVENQKTPCSESLCCALM